MALRLADSNWTTRGLADAAKRTKTKHAKSQVASESCPVTLRTVWKRLLDLLASFVKRTAICYSPKCI